jgi:hypothetical protein
MLDNELSSTTVSSGWHLMAVEVLAVGAFVVAAFLIWDRTRIWERTCEIETKFRKIEKMICLIEMKESRHLVMGLNGKSDAPTDKRGPDKASVGDIAEASISPAAAVGATRRRKNGKSSRRR